MLDSEGYRPNVGIVVANGHGGVLWAHRLRQGGWQFPQGGIQQRETPEQAMYRELHEEIGLSPEHVDVLGVTRGWLRYRLPEKLIRPPSAGRVCVGQKQKWFLLHLKANEVEVNMNATGEPEFSEWQWVSYWYPVTQIIDFKRWVYKRMLKELSSAHADQVRRIGRRSDGQ